MKRHHLLLLLIPLAALIFFIFNQSPSETAVSPPTDPQIEGISNENPNAGSEVARCPDYPTNNTAASANHQLGWSNTGNYLAYGQAEPEPKLFLLDLSAIEGDNLAPRLELSSIGWQFDWHPQADEIVYENNGQLVIHRLIDIEQTAVSRETGQTDSNAKWLPSGSDILFHRAGSANSGWHTLAANAPESPTPLFTTNQLDEEAAHIANRAFTSELAVNHNGEQVAFGVHEFIFVLDQAAGSFNQVSDATQCAVAPAWSADGSQIAYLAVPELSDTFTEWRLSIVDQNGQSQQLGQELRIQQFAWSPVDQRIAVLAQQADGRNDLYLVDLAEEGTLERIAETEWSETAVAWSPDGTQLALISAEHADDHLAQWHVELLTLATGEQVKIGRLAPR
ncbi:MAG: hypothetical protein AAF614_12150 [Chloroflexota bacterium]